MGRADMNDKYSFAANALANKKYANGENLHWRIA